MKDLKDLKINIEDLKVDIKSSMNSSFSNHVENNDDIPYLQPYNQSREVCQAEICKLVCLAGCFIFGAVCIIIASTQRCIMNC
tara:strand:- start:797 stop:1045 length:249 start_codon:yes stop_codon:yes gene_type:complete